MKAIPLYYMLVGLQPCAVQVEVNKHSFITEYVSPPSHQRLEEGSNVACLETLSTSKHCRIKIQGVSHLYIIISYNTF